MTARTQTAAATSSSLVAIVASALIGLAIVVVAGHVQSQALHDAAHDTRHATGFPCH